MSCRAGVQAISRHGFTLDTQEQLFYTFSVKRRGFSKRSPGKYAKIRAAAIESR
jgi:hypothetical protein